MVSGQRSDSEQVNEKASPKRALGRDTLGLRYIERDLVGDLRRSKQRHDFPMIQGANKNAT